MNRDKISIAAIGTGAVITGIGAFMGGRLGHRIAGFGMAQMLVGGANLIHTSAYNSMKRQINKLM